ncbi:MAG: MSMEG_4193 family putative phosphomutase [Candidatus Nanopelagicales bacterium]|nr:MSMEG_4193 family putative phosphomutase [Candidatus Nanopelagicales bacterium]
MTTLILVRHGRTAANRDGILAGWTPGVVLDEVGEQQAKTMAARLAGLPIAGIVSSPLERTVQTAEAIVGDRDLDIALDPRIGECRYGDWTGRPLKELAKEPLWKTVQSQPSAAVFPGAEGESIQDMAHRAIASVQHWNAQFAPDGMYVMVSHGDVIKAIVSNALGTHLDLFQRVQIDPCSISVIEFTPSRPFAVHVNDSGSDLGRLIPTKRSRRGRRGDAVVGGGAGHGA